MTIADALRGVTRVFLDTAPVIYYVERISPYEAVVDYVSECLDTGTLRASTSPITLAECLVGAYQSGDTTLQFDFYNLITVVPARYAVMWTILLEDWRQNSGPKASSSFIFVSSTPSGRCLSIA